VNTNTNTQRRLGGLCNHAPVAPAEPTDSLLTEFKNSTYVRFVSKRVAPAVAPAESKVTQCR
jgi:hypothetical protein